MKNPERFKTVKNTLEYLEYHPDLRLQLEQTMPENEKIFSKESDINQTTTARSPDGERTEGMVK